MWANYHTHSSFCDGKKSISEVVEQARSAGLIALGISSHAPLPFERAWCMKQTDLPGYLNEIRHHKKQAEPLEVYAGLEVDFIPNHISPAQFQPALDYSIGSIHFVDQFPDGGHWEIDGPHTHFLEGLDRIFHNNCQAAVQRYFELTRKMIMEAPPTIIGHLDKIKIQNTGNKFFHETNAWYRHAIRQTLDVIEKSDCLVEVNTRGLYQNKSTTTYPSPWVLEELLARNIPVTLSSDAHHPDDLINKFHETACILLKIGFKNLRILLDGRWQDVAFDENGIQPSRILHHPMA